MNTISDTVWVFHGEGGRFSGGVFSSVEKAEEWILRNKLTGILTQYPLDYGVYDWAILNDLFEIKKDSQREPKFIGGFTSGSQEHYHFEDGQKEG